MIGHSRRALRRGARSNAPSAAVSTVPPTRHVRCVYLTLFGSGLAGLGMRLLKKEGSDGHPANRPGAMTVADAAAAGRNQVPLGIAYTVGSTVMFAGGNAVVKWQLATYPLGEVAFGRTLFAFLTVTAIVLPRAGWGVLRTRLSQFGSMLCWLLAV